MSVSASHVLMLVSAILVSVCEAFANYAQAGGALPLHLTAAFFLTVATTLGAVSRSILAPEQAPAPAPLAPQVADQTAALLKEVSK